METVCKNALVAAVLLALCCDCWASIYSDCGSVDGAIASVDVSKCAPTARRCILRRNTNATMDISFTSNVDSDSLKAVVHGVIMGVDIPFQLPNADGCKDSGVACPVKAGTTYKYASTMPILASYPRVTVDIKWQLQDASGKSIICALIPAKIA